MFIAAYSGNEKLLIAIPTKSHDPLIIIERL